MSNDYSAQVTIGAQFTGQSATDAAKKALTGVHGEAENLNKQLSDLAKEGLRDLAAAFAVEKVFEFGKQLLETGQQLSELKEKTGISVDVLSELKTGAERTGVGFDSVTVALKKFSVAQTAAATGNVAQIAAFKNIGVSVDEIKSKNPSALLLDVVDKFSKLQDGPAKAAAAVKLFGKAGSELIPLLNQGTEGLAKFNTGMSDDFADRAKQFNNTLFDMGTQAKKLGVEVLGELLPTLQEITNSFSDSSGTSSGTLKFVDYLGEGLRLVAIAAKEVGKDLQVGFDNAETVIEAAGEALAYFAANTVDSLSTLAEEAKLLVTGSAYDRETVEDAYLARRKERDQAYNEDQEKRSDGLITRTLERNAKVLESEKDLAKNSLLLGDGTTAQILARQKAGTAPKSETPRTGKIGGGSEETKKETDAIEKYRIEQEKLIQTQLDQLDIADMSTASYKKLTEQNKLEAEEQKRGIGYSKEAKLALHEVTLELIAQNDALIDLQQEQKASFGQGAKQALHDYVEATKDVASQSKALFTHAFTGMEDALVAFVQTGKLSFSSLAQSIEADLIRIAAKQAIVGAIGSITGAFAGGVSSGLTQPSLGSNFGDAGSGAFGGLGFGSKFADGGVMTEFGSLPLNKYSSGGVANSPQAAIFGEGSKPEAYVPLPDGRSIPVTMSKNSGGGGGTNVSVSVNFNGDGSSTAVNSDSQKGKDLATLISGMISNKIIQEKRPGGLLS